jgi:hypothetical protein
MKLFRINPQSPEAIEVLCAIEAANNLSKKIREVFEYAVYAGLNRMRDCPQRFAVPLPC